MIRICFFRLKIQRRLYLRCPNSGTAPPAASIPSQWQIFSELDLKEEAEMLELARFLDSLISEFTPKDKKRRHHSIENLQVPVMCVH